MKKLLLGWVTLALAACNVFAPQPTPNLADLVVSLERTPCFGTCPIYKLTIYGDGRVVYQGERFVAVEGEQTSTISAEQVQALVAEIEKAKFFSLEDRYSAPATDLPSTLTSVTLNGQSKTIEHYGACGMTDIDSALPELCTLESKIDEIANSTQWVGK